MTETKNLSTKSSSARISTGGRAPKKRYCRSEYIADEAEEETEGEEEDQDEYEQDFIDDRSIDERQSIAWSRSASPVDRASTDGPANGPTLTPASTSKRLPDVSTPLVTRSRAKVGSDASTSPPAPSEFKSSKSLNTGGYKNSRSDLSVGKPSAAVVLGNAAPDTQKELEVVKTSPSGTKKTVDEGEWLKFQEYKAAMAAETTANTQLSDLASPRKSNASLGTRQIGERSAGKAVIGRKTVEFVQDTEDNVSTPPVTPEKPRISKKTTPLKRKRADTGTSSDDIVSAPVAAFNALREERTLEESASTSNVERPESKKAKRDAAPPTTAVLQSANIKKPKSSPKKCQVMDEDLQDELLKRVYVKGLPRLLAAAFYSWSSKQGVGMYMFSDLANDNPGVDITSVWSFVNFVQKDSYVNLAHILPSKLEAVSQIYAKDGNRWTLSINNRAATCVSVVNTVKSSLQQISAVNKSKSSAVPLLKYITGVHLSQEFDRVVGVCGMVFHHKGMHAQLNEDELTFGTKSTTADKLADTDSRKARAEGVQSSSTQYKRSTYNVTSDALDDDSEVPLYDGRGTTINAATDIDNLDDILPRYTENDGEIPNNSCTAVAYTVTQWKKKDEEHVTFNIKWAVVLGQPQ
ncbi:hypothetical protein K438DRAFT_1766818 [Mycena galopus ATCC 62051]|nr:hypothetical protein K438DRAFT_1766818 [Mycena galopus ATCC 62051]